MAFISPGVGQWNQQGNSINSVRWKPNGTQTIDQTVGGSLRTLAFSSGYYDSDRSLYITLATGGHGDYAGNEVYALDVLSGTSPTWSVYKPGSSFGVNGTIIPSPSDADSYQDAGNLFGDGVNALFPASVHSYGGQCYLRRRKLGFRVGGSKWSSGNPSQSWWTFDPIGKIWSRQGSSLSMNALGILTAYDEQIDRVWIHNTQDLFYVDSTGTLTQYTGSQAMRFTGDGAAGMCFDPRRRRLYLMGNIGPGPFAFGAAYIDLMGGATTWTNFPLVGGDQSFLNSQGLALLYDEVRDTLVAYGQGGATLGTLYWINPDTGDITVETGGGTIPTAEPAINQGVFGKFFRIESQDCYGRILAGGLGGGGGDTATFFYRPVFRTSRAFTCTYKSWTQQPYPGPLGTKLVQSHATKHMHSFSDESRDRIVFIGGDTPTGGTPPVNEGTTQGSDSNCDIYNTATGVMSHLAPRKLSEGGQTSGFMIDCPDNICMVHDTTHDLYLASLGFYGDGVTLDNSCGVGNHRPPTTISSNISVLNPSTGVWSIGPALSGALGIGGDSRVTGQGDYDPIGTRQYCLYGGDLSWYDTVADLWGSFPLNVVDAGGSGKCHREHVRVDIYGRKAYFIDPVAGKLCFASINRLDGTYGQNGYVTNPDIPGFDKPFRTDENQGMHIDLLNRIVFVPCISNQAGYSGYIHQCSYYRIQQAAWVNVPLTSADFSGGEIQGNFVQGAETVYDRAHNVFLLHSGNNGNFFPASGNPVPLPTKFALWRYWGGPTSATVPVAPSPHLTALSPASCAPGTSTFTLTVFGTGFTATNIVNWNGAARTTSFVNSNQLTATITSTDVATEGSNTVTVTSDAGDNSLHFIVTFGLATLSMTFLGKIRDCVGESPTALAPDGQPDGEFVVSLSAVGPRTVTRLALAARNGIGTLVGQWNTDGGGGIYVLGAAATAAGALLNNVTTMNVNFSVMPGGTFYIFGSDFINQEFLNGNTLTLTATFSDTLTATASCGTTLAVSTLGLTFLPYGLGTF